MTGSRDLPARLSNDDRDHRLELRSVNRGRSAALSALERPSLEASHLRSAEIPRCLDESLPVKQLLTTLSSVVQKSLINVDHVGASTRYRFPGIDTNIRLGTPDGRR